MYRKHNKHTEIIGCFASNIYASEKLMLSSHASRHFKARGFQSYLPIHEFMKSTNFAFIEDNVSKANRSKSISVTGRGGLQGCET
jgi:hypothetical protein